MSKRNEAIRNATHRRDATEVEHAHVERAETAERTETTEKPEAAERAEAVERAEHRTAEAESGRDDRRSNDDHGADASADRGSDDRGSDDHGHDAAEFTVTAEVNGVTTVVARLEGNTADTVRLDFAKFTTDSTGAITGFQEGRFDKAGTLVFETERLDLNESLRSVTIDGKAYVLHQEVERGQIEFHLYRDDNQDGIWTEIVEGHAYDTTADVVALIGNTTLLAQAATLIG